MGETTPSNATGSDVPAASAVRSTPTVASAPGVEPEHPATSAATSADSSVAVPLEPAQLAATYRLIAELLLYPEERDAVAIEGYRQALDGVPEATEPIDAFMASPRAHDLDEYLMLLELAPTCPLYLGTYMFEEPSSCRGAGLSDRNAYMIELKAIYRHFGFEPAGSEMADFLPLVAEFLALALDRGASDDIGLRRRLLKRHVAPALTPLREKLEKYESPYALLVACMTHMVERDAAACPEPPGGGAQALELPMLKPFIRSTAGGDGAAARPPSSVAATERPPSSIAAAERPPSSVGVTGRPSRSVATTDRPSLPVGADVTGPSGAGGSRAEAQP